MDIEFTKMSGAGNDFVLVDNRKELIRDGARAARLMCDRHTGIGADGLLLLESSSRAAYRMIYYNADGSYGGMCGNGGRCIAAFAIQNGIAPERHEFEALDFIYRAERAGSEMVLDMKDPSNIREKVVLPLKGKTVNAFFVDTGSPHVVIAARQLGRRGLSGVDVATLGQLIRRHKKFSPAGVNVNFVERNEDNSLHVRTYERGVEAETLACGTGSIASAVYGYMIEGLKPPVVIVPRSQEKLSVDFAGDGSSGEVRKVRLKGPARVTFRGIFEI